MLLLLLAHQNTPAIVTYYNKGGGDEAEAEDRKANADFFASYRFNEDSAREVEKIAWELGIDKTYSKRVTMSEFALRAYGESEKVYYANSEMKRLISTIDRKNRYKTAKAIAITGVVYVALRYMLFIP